ncbi:MAG: hypothetical protein GY928_16490 [Colwellia sp.]|nr:hypothetical protein [Colwellia sp.]
MATVITKTVKPSGGDYTLVSAAYADAPSSLVSAGEQWDIICDTFTGGLSDGFDAAAKACDATRFIRIAAASGHEYKHWDDSGFFMTALRNYDGVITSTSTRFLRIENVGFKNTSITGAKGLTLSSDDTTLSGVYATTAGTDPCFNLTGGVGWSVSNCLAEGGNLGFNTGPFTGGAIDKCTVIDSSNGYSKGGASRQLILTDSLYVGAGSFISGTNNFDATSDYNAGSDTTAPGSNSLDNRTTSDLADYVGGDYRTASASALATAGSVDFIGAFLGSGGGSVSDTLACDAFLSSSQFQVSDLFSSLIIESSSYQSATLFNGAQLLQHSSVSDVIVVGSYVMSVSFSDVIFSDTEALDDILTASTFVAATSFNSATLIESIAGDYLLSANGFTTSAVFNSSLLLTDTVNDANGSNTSTLFNDADLLKSSTDAIITDSFAISTTFNIASLSANSNYSHESSDTAVLFNNIDFRWSGDSAQVIGSVTAGFVSDTIGVGYLPRTTTANFK